MMLTDLSSAAVMILPLSLRSALSFSKASTRPLNSSNTFSSVKRFSDSTFLTSQYSCSLGDRVGKRSRRASTLAKVKCITSLVRSRPSEAILSAYVCSGTALMCPPLRPVAPLQTLRASRIATRTELSLSSRCLAMLHPVISEPMMTISASLGMGVDWKSAGGSCQ